MAEQLQCLRIAPPPSQIAADQDTESTLVTLLLGRTGDAPPETRKLLAIGYLWQGDVDRAVSLVCDMLCHPAPAGFRALLCFLLRFGHLKTSTVDANARKHHSGTLRPPLMPSPLSAKETAVIRLISRGHSNKSIARELHITPETVKCHAKKIFFKLSTRTRAEAVARATALGIL